MDKVYKLCTFSGRLGRWNYFLAAWAFPALLACMMVYFENLPLTLVLGGISALSIAVATARRLHDLNFSAWWLLTSCCSIIFFSNLEYFLKIFPFWMLVTGVLLSVAGNAYLLLIPGTRGENRFTLQ